MLSKHLLEHVVPPSVRRPDVPIPPAIDQLVLAAMAKDPGARPPSMEVFGEHLAAVLATLPGDPSRIGSAPRLAAPAPVVTPPNVSPLKFLPG